MSKTATLILGLLWAIAAQAEPKAQADGDRQGDPARGAALVRAFACGACHVIPGIAGAHGIVGPPLTRMAARGYLGGILANTPENMIRWLLDPPKVDPSTAMPKVGLSKAEARDVAAYLYTLE